MTYEHDPFSNRHNNQRAPYGRQPMTWQSEAPRARHQGGKFFNPPGGGTPQDFSARWPGDTEFSTPRINNLLSAARQIGSQYVSTRLALGHIPQDIHQIEEDIHHPATAAAEAARAQGVPLGLPMGARPMPPPTTPPALGSGPRIFPMGPGSLPDRPKMGASSGREAPDARRSFNDQYYSGRLNYPNAIDVTPGRRTYGGHDRRIKGIIQRQLDDRME